MPREIRKSSVAIPPTINSTKPTSSEAAPIQLRINASPAITALDGPQDCIEEHNRVYQRRRDRLMAALRGLGLRVSPPKASLYVWARIPDGTTSTEYATRLLEEAGVVVTPGVGYGPSGVGYVRLSLTIPDDRLEEGVRRLEALRL